MFFLVELANLIVFIWVVVYDKHSIGLILDVILSQTINAILFYYAYQMRIVKIKLESEDYPTFSERMKTAKIMWIILTIFQAISYSMDIIETIMIERNNNNSKFTPQNLKVISVISQILLLILYVILIYL
jgi:hypothetical protein